jgi:type I restriction enzyme S subunit
MVAMERPTKPSGVEWLGDVPTEWSVEQIRRRVRLRTAKASDSDRKVALENVESGTGRFIDVADADHSGDGIAFFQGDILFGKLRPYLSKVWRARWDGAAVGDFHVYAPGDDVEPKFFEYVLLSFEFISLVNGSTYGSKMPRASWDFIGALSEAFPPLAEQRQIADYLDAQTAKIDTLIGKQERLIETLAERRQSVISHAVTKGLDPSAPMKDSGVEWLGQSRTDWIASSLKRIITHQSSGTSVNGISTPAQASEVGVLKTSSVSSGVFFPHENKAVVPEDRTRVSCPVEVGAILVNRANSPERVGTAALVREDAPDLFLSDKLWKLSLHGADPLWLYWWLQTTTYRDQVSALRVGTSSSMQNLSFEDFREIRILVPPVDEQASIGMHLDRETSQIDALSAKARQMIDVLKERRQALISAAVTGKIDVRGLS